MFILDEKLKADSFDAGNLRYCKLLLAKNSCYPWFILVPQKPNLVEFTDLSFEDQINILKEINFVANFLQKKFKCDKINIATLGNVVRQLHIHIIARFKNDPAFPKPIWGETHFKEYDESELKIFLDEVRLEIENYLKS